MKGEELNYNERYDMSISVSLTPEIVIALMDSGMSQSEIARQSGLSRQYVSILAKRGGHVNPWLVVDDNLPWTVPADYTNNTIYKGVRRHGFFMAHGKKAMKSLEYKRLEGLWRKLRVFNQVIDFDPSYEGIPAISQEPGFTYLPRTEKDEDYIIKIRPGVQLTDIGKKIWRLPAAE